MSRNLGNARKRGHNVNYKESSSSSSDEEIAPLSERVGRPGVKGSPIAKPISVFKKKVSKEDRHEKPLKPVPGKCTSTPLHNLFGSKENARKPEKSFSPCKNVSSQRPRENTTKPVNQANIFPSYGNIFESMQKASMKRKNVTKISPVKKMNVTSESDSESFAPAPKKTRARHHKADVLNPVKKNVTRTSPPRITRNTKMKSSPQKPAKRKNFNRIISAFSDDSSSSLHKSTPEQKKKRKLSTALVIPNSKVPTWSSSSDDSQELPAIVPKKVSDRMVMAEAKRGVGNLFYNQKRYSDAIKCYTEAIELRPNVAKYYGNRAACHLMLKNFRQALEDSQASVKLDPLFAKGHFREARCHMMFGDLAASKRSLETVLDIARYEYESQIKKELNMIELVENFNSKIDESVNRRNYGDALIHLDQVLQHCSASVALKLKRAEFLIILERYKEAQALADDILQNNRLNADAMYIRGICLYYQENLEMAVAHFQHVLQLAPDHEKALSEYKKAKALAFQKESGNAAFKYGNYHEALNLYTNALSIDPNNYLTNARLYFNRATVFAKLAQHLKAIEDATSAIRLDQNYIKAYLRRATSYMDLAMFEEAVMDYEIVYSKESTGENLRLLSFANFQLARSKSLEKDYYKILGVAKIATLEQIKKAYKKMALQHHPDRHADCSQQVKLYREKKFKELGEAYQTLIDPVKKATYDSKMRLLINGMS